MERVRDSVRVGLGELGPLAGEELVHGPAPQPQPALEVTPPQANLRVQRGVGRERPARIGLRAEQDRLPDGGDPRYVRLDVELGYVDEDEADHRVNERTTIESAYKPLAIRAGLDVAGGGGLAHADNYGGSAERAAPAVGQAIRAGVRVSTNAASSSPGRVWKSPPWASQRVSRSLSAPAVRSFEMSNSESSRVRHFDRGAQHS